MLEYAIAREVLQKQYVIYKMYFHVVMVCFGVNQIVNDPIRWGTVICRTALSSHAPT